jgi:pyridoxal phosphate enzyme (YggS family)
LASAAEAKLRVFVQVNTSGEESKSGCEPSEAADLSKHILEKCPHLHLQGLMTIGAIARSKATSEDNPNEDFITLRQTRDRVAETIGIDKEVLELSMGMSEDFEGAIREGSTEVRVGSTIFGERPPKKDAKIKEDPQETRK